MTQIRSINFDEKNQNQGKSCTSAIATMAASSSDISFRERVFIRHATLIARRSGYNVTKSVIDATIIEANDGDQDSAILAKYFRLRTLCTARLHVPVTNTLSCQIHSERK